MLNWLCRYAPVRELLLGEAGRLSSSLLDVGCGPHGISCVAPDVPFVGLEVDYPQPPAPTMTAIKAPPGRLPFADASFGAVVCLDVLEHVPRPDRAGLIAELARVAAERVILACPNDECAPIDEFLAQVMPQLGHGLPGWLQEHRELVLPSETEVEAFVRDVAGFDAAPLAMPNGLFSALVALGDVIGPDPQLSAHEAHARREEWIALCNAARFGPSLRAAWVLERTEVGAPIVDPAASPDTVAAALRCVSCGGSLHTLADAQLQCTGCGHVVPRTPGGWWDLGARQFEPLGHDPARSWFAEPSWDDAALERLLEAFAGASPGGETLILHAAPTALTGPDAAQRLTSAIRRRPLPPQTELIVVDEPLGPDDLATLRTCRTLPA